VSDGHDVVDQILNTGGAATVVYLDITDEAGWQRLVSLADDAGHTIRGLVNNAGVSFRHGFEDNPTADWHRVIYINLTGAFLGIRTVARAWRPRDAIPSSTSRPSRGRSGTSLDLPCEQVGAHRPRQARSG
jgi:NAD(P)-dependent dehydrogenase (short-subunit alcohol dehydrogenase family)